jgi:hypothetical protein
MNLFCVVIVSLNKIDMKQVSQYSLYVGNFFLCFILTSKKKTSLSVDMGYKINVILKQKYLVITHMAVIPSTYIPYRIVFVTMIYEFFLKRINLALF